MSARARSFDKYWEVCGLPRGDRLNHAVTWDSAVRETCVHLAQLLPGVTLERLLELAAPLKGIR